MIPDIDELVRESTKEGMLRYENYRDGRACEMGLVDV
jgi:hypothetical protein